MSLPPLRSRILSAITDEPGSGNWYGTRGIGTECFRYFEPG